MIRLAQLRFDAGLSPNQLSIALDGAVSAKTIRSLEVGGDTNRQPSKVKAIADYFGVTPTELLRPVENEVAA